MSKAFWSKCCDLTLQFFFFHLQIIYTFEYGDPSLLALCFDIFDRGHCKSSMCGHQYQRHLAVSRSQHNPHVQLPRHTERFVDFGFLFPMAASLLRYHQRQLFFSGARRTYDRTPVSSSSSKPIADICKTVYNKTAPATGSLDFPLNYALEPFSCHFELSRLPAVGQGPPYALSGNFNVAIESNQKPVTWSQATGNPSSSNTSPSGSSTTSEPTTTSTSTSSPAATTTPTPSSGLSQGAKIGIGVGVALGVLALLAAAAGVFFMLRRRRRIMGGTGQLRNRNAQSYATPQANGPGYAAGKSEWSELPVDKQVHEKDSEPVAAMGMGELEGSR